MLRALSFFRWLLLACLLLPAGAQTGPAPATSPPAPPPVYLDPKNYSQLWVDKTAVVTPEAVAATVAGVKKQQANPDHIVVFIHGFDVKRNSSTAEFDGLASRLQTEFDSTRTRAAYAGIQWESASDQSVFQLANVYWQKISVARSTGRGPARELLLALQKEFPKAHISLMAHSMGCEVAAAALVPEIEYADQVPFVPTFEPGTEVKLNMVALCGSDLDYDIWSKSRADARAQNQRANLNWQTISPYEKGKKDKVLSYRARLRGKAAGSAFPKMTLQQIDEQVGNRRILLDGRDIPTSHDFSKYYDQARLARMVPVMLYLVNPRLAKPPELAEVDQILMAPDDVNALLPYLDGPQVSTLFYALWKLERVNCGDARHMTDGTLEVATQLLREKPKMIWRVAPKSECATLKNEHYPTTNMMTRAGAPPRSRK